MLCMVSYNHTKRLLYFTKSPHSHLFQKSLTYATINEIDCNKSLNDLAGINWITAFKF